MATTRNSEVDYYKDMLRTNGFVSVDFGISGADIDPLFAQFNELTDIAFQPDGSGKALIDAFHYTIPGRPNDADYYLTHRIKGDINPYNQTGISGTDEKYLAHVGPLTLAYAHSQLGRRMPIVMRRFIELCLVLHEEAKRSAEPVFRALGIADALLAKDSTEDIHMVRVLRYLGTQATYKAGLHFDRSVATVAAWENKPGLVGAAGHNGHLRTLDIHEADHMAATATTTPIAHRSGQAKVFLGAGYQHLPTEHRDANAFMPLLLHGVINDTPGEERNAVVVFMNPHRFFKGYSVPNSAHETGFDEVRNYILRRRPPHEDVA
ncbi:MAG TPA: hypothetical protein VFN56_00755 [Candidatus Saccharimonadales bacterium]|nr:hypothetical protein [Candidatus Saccharimonadales bacterium]